MKPVNLLLNTHSFPSAGSSREEVLRGLWRRGPSPRTDRARATDHYTGFTLLEVMISVALFSLVVGGAIGIYIMCQKMWHATSLSMQTNREGNFALSRMVYGVGTNNGLRTAASVIISSNANGWRMTCSNAFDGVKHIDYYQQASNIYWVDSASQSNRICAHVSSAVVSTNASGVNIQLTIFRNEGQFTSTNQVSTFVLMRNKKE